ncbi:sugar ABC transporter ATP-binding protein [Treponema primitia]|uniref:sugar ABC transporter ATP-binding protein n=1 Tax=Treponema primitia TaxID=88058 RepID=UPI00025551C2|nr:sugar ABC transporter ATP-binding protein [Treponema primitia]
MDQFILSVKNITKKYPGVKALDKVSMDFSPGEVHAIMGENGAGKSTLIKIIAGAEIPDEGTIVINGQSYDRMRTKTAKNLGIAIIYQELMMVPELSVAENVFLGSLLGNMGVVNYQAMQDRTSELFTALDLKIDPKAKVKTLSVAFQQLIEIARALSRNAKILIMDEPSAALTEEEVDAMLRLILRLKESGVTVLYISHRLDEVFRISDRISILRDGAYITTLETSKTNRDELIRYMVGRSLGATFPERDAKLGEVEMEVRNFTGNGVHDISFSLRRGEILGIGGLVGAGRTELAQLIYGAVPAEGGELYLKGRRVHIKNPRDAVQNGIALIPEDRKQHGLLLEMNVLENISLPLLHRMSRALFVNYHRVNELSMEQKNSLSIKTPSLAQTVKNLSGGNQQKVVLAKWLAAQCDYLIFDEPTRGIDVGAKQEIYKLLNQLAAEGKCIIMISSEMEELIGISDRIIVLCEGRLMGELQKQNFSQAAILAMASGE